MTGELVTTNDDQRLRQQNIALFQRWFVAANSFDFAALADIYHPGITTHLPWAIDPFPKVVHGLKNVMAFSRSVPQFAISLNHHGEEIHTFADDPNELYATYRSDMKLVSGREYKNEYHARATVKDGKIIRKVEWPNPIALLVAMSGSVNLPTDFAARIVTSTDGS